ncbi:MAG: guanylate kinase [Bacteroidota bacterium]
MEYTSRKAIIFAGPSGSGKTTIARHLVVNNDNIRFSVSACTRPKRIHEVHGQDYYFLSVREFQRMIAQDAFIEWEEVYADSYYGTLKAEVDKIWAEKKTAVFDMDVQGGLRLKSYFKEDAIAIYVQVPSLKLLTERLRMRQTESEESITLRINKVASETALATKFDVILANEHLPTSLDKAQTLLEQLLSR